MCLPTAAQQTKIREVLWQLTPDQRQVILLKYYENWSNIEVARAIGKPVGAVKALQHRGLTLLRSFLKNEEI
jgi:RNA polymerase sigma-70 factor (ECF subfamily)